MRLRLSSIMLGSLLAWPVPSRAEERPLRPEFPSSYEASRSRFRADCAAVLRHEHGLCQASTVASRTDPDLTIDFAYITRGHRRLVILQSGLHGAEGFAGAAIQHRFIAEHMARMLDHGFDVLLIHAMNPYGFKNGRRVDEDNVDLNRNFATDPALFHDINRDYASLRDVAEPHRPVFDPGNENFNIQVRTIADYVLHGFDFGYVANGTHAGQYAYPQGFIYGGHEPQPQTRFLETTVAPIIGAHAGDVLFLDLHTGLGASNTLTVYSGLGWSGPRRERLQNFIGPLGQALPIRTQSPDQSAFQTKGDVIDFVPSLVPGAKVTAVTLEWGTIGEDVFAELRTNAVMILETQAHFHGCLRAEDCRTVRRDFADLFNPPDRRFQDSVLDQADAFLNALAALPENALDEPGPRLRR